MTFPLPVNIDTTYADTGSADVKAHQQYHDSVHGVVNQTRNLAANQTLYVSTTGNDANDGLGWGTAKATLLGAVSALPRTSSGTSTQGGLVIMGAGVFRTSTRQDFFLGTSAPNNVTIRGAGRGATILCRSTDVEWGRIYGVAGNSGGSTPHIEQWSFEDLSFEGTGPAGENYGSTILTVYAAAEFRFTRVDWNGGLCTGVDLVEVWDSSFSDCRFDNLGGAISSNKPAVNIRGAITGATSGQFGYGADSSNNILFTRCWWETFREGALWIDRQNNVAGFAAHRIRLVQCKFESLFTEGVPFRATGCNYLGLSSVSFTIGGQVAGRNFDAVRLFECSGVTITDVGFEFGSGVQTTRAGISINSSTAVTVNNVYGAHGLANKPSLALIEWAGTNTKAGLGNYDWFFTDGTAAPLVSGGPTSLGFGEVQNRYVALTADITTTSTTQADFTTTAVQNTAATTRPFHFDVVASGVYNLQLVGTYRSSVNSAGPRFALGSTTTPATVTSLNGIVDMATSPTARTQTVVTALTTAVGANPGTANTDFAVRIDALIRVNAAGQIGLRWAMSAAGTATLRTGAICTLTRVA